MDNTRLRVTLRDGTFHNDVVAVHVFHNSAGVGSLRVEFAYLTSISYALEDVAEIGLSPVRYVQTRIGDYRPIAE
jgi:hypothetical protein